MAFTKEALATIQAGAGATFSVARFGAARFGQKFTDIWQREALTAPASTKETLSAAGFTSKEALNT